MIFYLGWCVAQAKVVPATLLCPSYFCSVLLGRARSDNLRFGLCGLSPEADFVRHWGWGFTEENFLLIFPVAAISSAGWFREAKLSVFCESACGAARLQLASPEQPQGCSRAGQGPQCSREEPGAGPVPSLVPGAGDLESLGFPRKELWFRDPPDHPASYQGEGSRAMPSQLLCLHSPELSDSRAKDGKKEKCWAWAWAEKQPWYSFCLHWIFLLCLNKVKSSLFLSKKENCIVQVDIQIFWLLQLFQVHFPSFSSPNFLSCKLWRLG